jgi:hypothetical protein
MFCQYGSYSNYNYKGNFERDTVVQEVEVNLRPTVSLCVRLQLVAHDDTDNCGFIHLGYPL